MRRVQVMGAALGECCFWVGVVGWAGWWFCGFGWFGWWFCGLGGLGGGFVGLGGGFVGLGGVLVGDVEVGEAGEVDGCCSGGEPEVVGGGSSVGHASGFVACEPGYAAFDHGALSAVDGADSVVGPAGFVGFAVLVVGVDGVGAPGVCGGATRA